jgi:hypothetical protein
MVFLYLDNLFFKILIASIILFYNITTFYQLFVYLKKTINYEHGLIIFYFY